MIDPEALQETRELLLDAQRGGKSLEDGARRLRKWAMGNPEQLAAIDAALQSLREEAGKNRILEIPPSVHAEYSLEEERIANWYVGPQPGDKLWGQLSAVLRSKFPDEDYDSLDSASTKVVANLADPHVQRLKKRGLVLGYVQSGKTANYTAAIAKAADAGYRFIIVLAGMHNNLRRQTQLRLLNDLHVHDWVQLTDEEKDFGGNFPGTSLMANATTRMLAVVKKNSHRLNHLKKWLAAIPEDVRAVCPVLLLDDEADQATPNSQAARDEMSAINRLLKEIWDLTPTGSYVGYTATPFANIFMNPNDEQELYPADFIIDLPRPKAYFGAERLFGASVPQDSEQEDDGLDVVRSVPEEDTEVLTPTRPRDGWEGSVPRSLEEALTWFVLATAIRRARGQKDHSSMLIHTTHFVDPHFAMRDAVGEWLDALRKDLAAVTEAGIRELWEAEKDRAAVVRQAPMPTWPEIRSQLPGVVGELEIIVDNGSSDERLDYAQFNTDGSRRLRTVVAIGGGTLSRGLTLEGLVVSYFIRTSNTYDTLLQMGRWFGYRPGYEDLQRIWATDGLAEDFRFLGVVEQELRSEIRTMELQRKTPRELGIRVRSHPGRLEITARAKMFHAGEVDLDFSGDCRQTFILHETDLGVLAANKRAARRLLERASARSVERGLGQAHKLWRGCSVDDVIEFLAVYRTHEDQRSLDTKVVSGWLKKFARDTSWNVALMHGSKAKASTLGTVDLGVGEPVPLINRAPLQNSPVGTANIKTLRSAIDRVADLPAEVVKAASPEEYANLRSNVAPKEGLIALYPLSPRSVPANVQANSRRPMQAPLELIGYAIAFPTVRSVDSTTARSYWAVTPDWAPEISDDEDEVLAPDREGDMAVNVDGVLRS